MPENSKKDKIIESNEMRNKLEKRDNINKETLNKIKFFINNSYTNPSSYKVDIEHDIFYNIENTVLQLQVTAQ